MPTSLPTKPSSPLATRRQLPQHPKMRLLYILNPSPQRPPVVVQPVVQAPVLLPEEPVLDFSSRSCSSDFRDVITRTLTPDLRLGSIGSSLPCHPTPLSSTTTDHELPSESQPISRSGSPSLLLSVDLLPMNCVDPAFSANLSPHSLPHPPPHRDSSTQPSQNSRSLPSDDLSPLIPSFVPDISFDVLRYPVSYNSNTHPENYHDSRGALGPNSPINPGGTELSISPDRSPIRLSPLQPHDSHNLPNSSITNTDSEGVEETTPGLVEPNPLPSPTSRSPSPALSNSELSSPSTSDFHLNGSPVLTGHFGSRHDECPLQSPVTTPLSSPGPIPHPVADLPPMVQPPQLLAWEGPPPPGLNARNHRAYQRAGVHWMLGQIFGPDIG